HGEERRRAGGVHVADDPAVVDIAHDVFDRCECTFRTGGEAHRQPDTGQQLVDQHQQRQHAEEIPEIEIFRRVVLTHMGIPRAHDRETLIYPIPQTYQHFRHYAFPPSTPMMITESLSYECGGTSRLLGAGTLL